MWARRENRIQILKKMPEINQPRTVSMSMLQSGSPRQVRTLSDTVVGQPTQAAKVAKMWMFHKLKRHIHTWGSPIDFRMTESVIVVDQTVSAGTGDGLH